MTKLFVFTSVLALTSTMAMAQTPGATGRDALTTRPGTELNLSVQHYDYTEPAVNVSMHAPKIGAEYVGTFSVNQRHRWFAQLSARGTGFVTNYDGQCRPWLIVPDSTFANGYRLTVGAPSPCSESGDVDWYAEGRLLTGKDFVGRTWAFSPFAGAGVRHLSNGTTGHFNYRTQGYLYVPLGATVRTTAIAGRVLSVTMEYDHLLRGWNTTRNSLLTGGTVPATSTAPAFTIGDFTNLSFTQHRGWAVRASASYRLSRSWSIEPYYIRWRVSDSPISDGSVAYTVNGITARRTLGYYEPLNFTKEFGVKIGLKLR